MERARHVLGMCWAAALDPRLQVRQRILQAGGAPEGDDDGRTPPHPLAPPHQRLGVRLPLPHHVEVLQAEEVQGGGGGEGARLLLLVLVHLRSGGGARGGAGFVNRTSAEHLPGIHRAERSLWLSTGSPRTQYDQYMSLMATLNVKMGSQSMQKPSYDSAGSEELRSARLRGSSRSVHANSCSQTCSTLRLPGRLGTVR